MLLKRTPYGAERSWVRDKDGNHLWLVAVRATYDFDDVGRLRLADEQPPPTLEPVHFGKPESTSLRYDIDLVDPKPTTDVIVNGTAYAPGGQPTRTVQVAARIHNVQKVLLVHGPRVYWQSPVGLACSEARPFTAQPIVYEWAYGGYDQSDSDPRRHKLDPRNPVGRGVAASAATLVDQPAHRIEYPNGAAVPAGFGAIASHWSPRIELGGTYDAAWSKSRAPLLPADYDPRTRLCSPVDQRPAQHLVGGEGIALSNMTPKGMLALKLPVVRLLFMTHLKSSKAKHGAILGTVIVEPDIGKLTLVFQTRLVVKPRDLDNLDATIITEPT